MNTYQLEAEKQIEFESAEDALWNAYYDNDIEKIEKARQVLFMVSLKTGLKSEQLEEEGKQFKILREENE